MQNWMQMTARQIKKEQAKRLIKQGPSDIVREAYDDGEMLIEYFETKDKMQSRQQTLSVAGRRLRMPVTTRSFVDKRRLKKPHGLVIEAVAPAKPVRRKAK